MPDPIPMTNGMNGGRRPGAGRPKKTAAESRTDAYSQLAKAKAKRETYRAHLEELKFKQASGEMVPADDAREAMSTMLKAIMLTLDTLTEVVEREAKLSPTQADAVQMIIDRERRSLHTALINSGPAT